MKINKVMLIYSTNYFIKLIRLYGRFLLVNVKKLGNFNHSFFCIFILHSSKSSNFQINVIICR